MPRKIPGVIWTQITNRGVGIAQGAKIKTPGIVHHKRKENFFIEISIELKIRNVAIMAAKKAQAAVLEVL